MKPRAPEADRQTAADLPKVIQLAKRGSQEFVEITELEPSNGKFIGKHINQDGSITQYPLVTWWRQSVAQVPATIPRLFTYLREARTRNICLIRGAPANLERQPTRRIKAGLYGAEDRGNHGFIDEPTRLFWFDVDDERINWRADPEDAIRTLVELLGEPWASTSFVWFFSATHGLERDGHKRWTGRIIDGSMRVRIVFITERALGEREAVELTNIARARIPALDRRACLTVQPNYIRRAHWVEHPDRDVLGDIPTIGWVRGKCDCLAVPADLTTKAHWAKAEGYSNSIANHPDAESAVRGIGSDGEVRPHVTSAVVHLLRANPPPDVVSFDDYSTNIIARLRNMIERHREEISDNLVRNGRSKHVVEELLQHTNPAWALWCLNHQGILRARTIKLIRQEKGENVDTETADAIFARVARTIERACRQALANEGLEKQRADLKKQLADLKKSADPKKQRADLKKQRADLKKQLAELKQPPAELLVAPTGSRKSTLMRAAAVEYVTKWPNKTVVILMPRHKLSDEQIRLLGCEHPDGNYSAAVWRGRHADDPETPDPQTCGKYLKMCQRSEEAKEVEKVMLDVESSLCKRGRGEKAVKCPLYDSCAYQRQKRVKANIWFAAHECAVHEMPKAFGDVGWVIFDESPLDAFMFGVDINDPVTLELDALSTPMRADRARFKGHYDGLMRVRKNLYHALDKLQVPIEFHLGAAASRQSLKPFIEPPGGGNDIYAKDMRKLWSGKVEPRIRPDTPGEQLKIKLQEAAGNGAIKKEVTLWELVQLANSTAIDDAMKNGVTPEELIRLIEAVASNGRYGRIQVHRGKEGRIIRMAGVALLAKGWNVPTLICDATGDAELLKPIWPQLEEPDPHGWEQLPRPANVRIFQCVDRAISKWAVGVEGKHPKELKRKAEGARRLYAAVLVKALEYGGQDVGVIVYKSTKDWILKNCFVPEWLKLLHWGDLTGTNALEKVRALFVIGRPLASTEAVTRMAEALFGKHIAMREYRKQEKQGRIPIIPDAKGNNCIMVDVWEHPDPMAERLRRQITEGSLIQAGGRARAGLRGGGEPLDIHLWTDVPLPELGPVEPVLWAELDGGLDGLMLAMGGCWLKNIADAVRAFGGLFTADGLKTARASARADSAGGGVGVLHIIELIYKTPTPPFCRVAYRRAGGGCKPTEAVFLRGVADPRAWLEARLGPLARFEILGDVADVAGKRPTTGEK